MTRPCIAHLTHPFPAFLALATQIPIYPMEVVEEQGDMKTNVVGAGPFVFKEWQADNFTLLEAYDGYWDPEIPHIETIRILPGPTRTCCATASSPTRPTPSSTTASPTARRSRRPTAWPGKRGPTASSSS